MAALRDIRIATDHSSFGLPEVRLSLMPSPGLVELGRLIPLGEALRIQLTGRPMTGRRAFDIGFVQALLPNREALVAEATQIAAEIALGAPLAVEAYRPLSNRDEISPSKVQTGCAKVVGADPDDRGPHRGIACLH